MLMELPALTACTLSEAIPANSAVDALAMPPVTVAAPAFMAAVKSSPAGTVPHHTAKYMEIQTILASTQRRPSWHICLQQCRYRVSYIDPREAQGPTKLQDSTV